MATVTLKNIPDEIYSRLKKTAQCDACGQVEKGTHAQCDGCGLRAGMKFDGLDVKELIKEPRLPRARRARRC